MAEKNKSKLGTHQGGRQRSLLLALTLVPLVAGVLFIVAWAFDVRLVGRLEDQAFLGLLFILAGFALSNLIQGKALLAAGWTLLFIADFLLLTQVRIQVQIPALILAVLGLGIVLFEFYRQYRQNSG